LSQLNWIARGAGFSEAFGMLSVGTKLLAGTVCVVGGGTITYFYWRRVVGYVAIGPYPTVVDNPFSRGLQRSLVDWTKRDLSLAWFPLNSFIGTGKRRVENGHAISGAVRDSARELITMAILAIGRKKFEFSPARQSEPDGAVHQHYAAGDLHRTVSEDVPDNDSVIVGIDIDYYVRDPGVLLGYGLPVILHTFNPVAVAGTDGDSRFRIQGGEVIYDVSGGSSWKHQVWDWCAYGEFVETEMVPLTWAQWALKYCGRLVGLQRRVYHKIHYARPWEECPHRALVWCMPAYSCWRSMWIGNDLGARELKRVAYQSASRPGWNTLVSQEGSKLNISFGREGDDLQVTMPKEHVDVLLGLSTAQSVTSRMLGLGYKDPAMLALFGQFYSGKPANVDNVPRVGNPITPRVHWPVAMEADLPEVTARVYSNPVVNTDNCVPMVKRWEVLSNSLERRVTDVRNNKVPHKRYANFAKEFVSLVVPHEGVGVPYSLEETATMLDKPSQVLAVKQVWETADMEPRRLIESFVKNEPCAKSPRIISSYADMRYLLSFSRFTLAFRDEVLHAEHNQHWFCPGSTPQGIADKVTEYVRSVETPIEGDYSNMDGTVSEWLQRHVMNATYHRHFAAEYRAELTRYTEMLIRCPARAKRFGFRYDAGCGVKSGGPTTCDCNSHVPCFCMYCAIRIVMPELTPEEAFRLVGLCFGDDSLFEERFRRKFVQVAEDLGLLLKVERFKPETGVTFLARVFPDPFKTNTSFQDPLRTWRKLHMTFRDPTIRLADAATDRLEGYLVTDPFSPVTSAYARAMTRYYGSESPEKASALEVRQARRSATREKPYWLTVGGSWPQAEEDFELMLQCAAARTGFDAETLRATHHQLEETHDPWGDFTLTSDPEVSHLVGTLDEDAQPAEGTVDLRIFQHDRNTNCLREGGELSGAPQGARGKADVRNGRSEVHRANGAAGPASLQRVRESEFREGEAGHRRPPVKATRSRVPARGGYRPRQDAGSAAPGNRGVQPAARQGVVRGRRT